MPTRPQLVLVPMPRHDEAPDEVLVTRARKGDREALGQLVVRHQRTLFALCLRYVGDRDEAADLVQKSFVRVMAKLDDLRDTGMFRAWLLRIGAHLALNHIRDHARFVSDKRNDSTDDDERELRAHDLSAGPDAPALERLEAAEAAATLRDAVSNLPTKQRMTLELRIYEDLPFRDIATALEISEGAAKVNFHYAVKKLRKMLSP